MLTATTTQYIFNKNNDADMYKYRQLRNALVIAGYIEHEGKHLITFTLRNNIQCEVKNESNTNN